MLAGCVVQSNDVAALPPDAHHAVETIEPGEDIVEQLLGPTRPNPTPSV
jgi:hypothetical protein